MATIGAEPTNGIERFMFGNYDLYEGLSFVPVFIGLFAMSELLVQSKKANQIASAINMKAVKLTTIEDYKKIWKTIVRSCGIRNLHRYPACQRSIRGLDDQVC